MPEGLSVLTQGALLNASDSLRSYAETRAEADRLVAEFTASRNRRACVEPNGPLTDVVRLMQMGGGLAPDHCAARVAPDGSGSDVVIAEDGSNGQ